MLAVDAEGEVVFGRPCDVGAPAECRAVWKRLVLEAWNWGEPAVSLCPTGRIVCGIPLMRNGVVLGGLVADGLPADSDAAPTAPRAVGETLLALAVGHNLTNAAHLELRRAASDREREHTKTIHALKVEGYDSIRAAYLREEPGLLAAVKRGDRREARTILNRLLVGIYHLGGHRIELLKSLTLELVVMIYRAAVEAGARPAELLGMNYDCVGRLSKVGDEEELCHWLTDTLERLMDGIREFRDAPNAVLLQQALRFMERNLDRDLSRDEVARVACLSPSHFSHLVKEKVGRSFRALLLDARVARASELLRRTPRSVADIAAACGFCDQSRFGKVFRRRTGLSPSAYRRRHAPALGR